MEWSNIRMSKAEFERLQKEYAEAAIRTAEKQSSVTMRMNQKKKFRKPKISLRQYHAFQRRQKKT